MASTPFYLSMSKAAINSIEEIKKRSGLDDRQLFSVVIGFVFFLWVTIRVLIRLAFGKKRKSSSSSKKKTTGLHLPGVNPNQVPQAPPDVAKDEATAKESVSLPDNATLLVASPTTSLSATKSSTPPASPQSPPPLSPQVLHSGSLKKRTVLSSSVSSVELVREDEQNIAILYAPGAKGYSASPRSKRKSFYLGTESYVDVGSRTKFVVHQLKSGGKKLYMDAMTPEERDLWVSKIQEAVNLLKLERKF